ncbi:HAMP domain-containing protein [Trebonia kvetii]|uniref:Oxygen sensor histidine kinase NreB n=1 Tax=Trebonia kvetii TaxID=2480626 RepID=A0A6P2BVD7_9ACTN|nr:sensor histidine kinase [Trebonia kvetii]TVZ03024.1 HAMP domain-containing protein [Trebonia kvetii]
MTRRWGLQATMTATYVAVTAGVVLLTELVIFGVAALSPPTPLTRQAVQGLAQATAQGMTAKLDNVIGKLGTPKATQLDGDLTTGGGQVAAGQARPDGNGGVVIPRLTTAECDVASASFAVVVSRAGLVLASSYPACFPRGSHGSDAQQGVPRKVLSSFVRWAIQGGGQAPLPSGNVVWATAPITAGPGADQVKGAPSGAPSPTATGGAAGSGGATAVAMLYLEVPATAPGIGGVTVSPGLVRTGMVLLAAAIPVGLAFGLLSTRRLTRRLGRLAALTQQVGDGDFGLRVPVHGHDEVSRLEENFNRMAGQLQAWLDATRQLGAANARHEERTRIARELHDSISQELFSLNVLAGGLRRALPAKSPVLPQVEIMERTAGDTMREMRSLLLALRPVALEEADLPRALDGVCQAYRDRLGIPVRAEVDLAGLEADGLPPAVEHAMLRVTQEAVGNAARHADPARITVRLRGDRGQAVLEISDDGRGFDVAAPRHEEAGGLGLHTMRDRVAELGGLLTVQSAPGEGTTIRARFPLREAIVTGEAAVGEGVAGGGAAGSGVAGGGVAGSGVAGGGVAGQSITEEAR